MQWPTPTIDIRERIENGQMMMFIAEWTANFAATLRRTFTDTWTLPPSQIGYWTLVQPCLKSFSEPTFPHTWLDPSAISLSVSSISVILSLFPRCHWRWLSKLGHSYITTRQKDRLISAMNPTWNADAAMRAYFTLFVFITLLIITLDIAAEHSFDLTYKMEKHMLNNNVSLLQN